MFDRPPPASHFSKAATAFDGRKRAVKTDVDTEEDTMPSNQRRTGIDENHDAMMMECDRLEKMLVLTEERLGPVLMSVPQVDPGSRDMPFPVRTPLDDRLAHVFARFAHLRESLEHLSDRIAL